MEEKEEAQKIIAIIDEFMKWFNASKPTSSGNTPENSFNTPTTASKTTAIKWLNDSGWFDDAAERPPVTLTAAQKNEILKRYVKPRDMTFVDNKKCKKFWEELVGKETEGDAKVMLNIPPFISINARKFVNRIQITFEFESKYTIGHDYSTSNIYDNNHNNLYSRIKEKVSYVVRDLVRRQIQSSEDSGETKETKETKETVEEVQGDDDFGDDDFGDTTESELNFVRRCMALSAAGEYEALHNFLEARAATLEANIQADEEIPVLSDDSDFDFGYVEGTDPPADPADPADPVNPNVRKLRFL